jgi:tetratricopeptide (TPR) repeat protein
MYIARRSPFLLISSLILMLIASPSTAQNRLVKGTVIDDKDQPVAGALIEIQSPGEKSRVYRTTTDKKGNYLHMGIMAGEYRVVVHAKGFQPDYRPSIRPSVQEDTAVDFKLKPGSENQRLPFELTSEEIEEINKETARAEQMKQSPGETQVLFDEGLQLMKQEKYEEAVEQFRKALEKDPQQHNIIGNMADAYAKMNKYDEALEFYKKAIAAKPDDAPLYTNMGIILGKMGKNAELQAAFKKAAELNPGASAQNFYNIGASLINNGKTAEAADAFTQAITADSNFAEAYFQLGICQSGTRDSIPEAIKNLKKYMEIGKKQDNVETAKQIIAALQQPSK